MIRSIAMTGMLFLFAGCSTTSTPTSTWPDMNKPGQLKSGVYSWDKVTATQTRSGQRRGFFDSPTRTMDNMEMHVTTLNPGEAPHAPHQHVDEELILLKEGTLEATVNGKSEVMPTGSAFFIASGDLHGIKNIGTTQATYFVLRWFPPGTKATAPTTNPR